MRVIVCGSRTWNNREAIERELRKLPRDSVVIHGACDGADTIAGDIAEEIGLEVRSCPARWLDLGNGAGLIRNRFMLNLEPDKVIAFCLDILKSDGTRDMVSIARAKLVPVEVFNC